MTKPDITSRTSQPIKAGRISKSKATASPQDKWNPNVPFHVTQEEFWEHIHEIEKGPFIPAAECFKHVRAWIRSGKHGVLRLNK